MGKSKDTRRVEANQAMAVCHSIRTSPRKLNLVAQTIRGLNAEKAVAELSFSKKRIAKVVWPYCSPQLPMPKTTPSYTSPSYSSAKLLSVKV